MASRSHLLSAVLLVVLLLAGGEMIGTAKLAEARLCESRSFRYKGPCMRETNCANVCRIEGFHGGKCRGFRRRCFCTRYC